MSMSGGRVGLRAKYTNPFEVSMYETGTVNILQALSCPVQLLVTTQLKKWEENEVTYELQSVDGILLDVLHNVPVLHPFGNSDKFSIFHISVDAYEIQDVWVGQCAPEYDFLAKSLETV